MLGGLASKDFKASVGDVCYYTRSLLSSYIFVSRSNRSSDRDIARVFVCCFIVPCVVGVSLPKYRLLARCVTAHANCCL